MVINQELTHEIVIWGISLPAGELPQADKKYLLAVASLELPPLQWVWQEMDRVWDVLVVENRTKTRGQAIGEFYSHPVWVVNGVFTAVDPDSINHRNAIAAFVSRTGAKKVADYGGGFGELALRLHSVASEIQVDIVEPYPSKPGMTRVEGKAGIKFVKKFESQYDCVVAQDVLEHLDQPLVLAKQMVNATRPGGYLIFANCFFPVIKCHLPSTFYLRYTFRWLMWAMGLKYQGRIEGANHVQVFKRTGKPKIVLIHLLNSAAKLTGPILNTMIPILRPVRQKIRAMWL